MTRGFVVITGIAASGKSTVAAAVSDALRLPLVQKDAITEALFGALGTGDLAWARTLSRAADDALLRVASGMDTAVLDNYWRADTVERLLGEVRGPFVELWCRCEPELAAARFAARTRHPGHRDDEREISAAAFSGAAERFPFRTLGPVVEVDTAGAIDIDEIVGRIRPEVAA